MKKVFVLAISAAIFAFVACGESNTKEAEAKMQDSIRMANEADSVAKAMEAAQTASQDSTQTDSTKTEVK